MSGLVLMQRLHWVDTEALQAFILSTQDSEGGGMADRPDDEPDVFHTCFGLAGLSLLGYDGLAPVDPLYCLPLSVTRRLGINSI